MLGPDRRESRLPLLAGVAMAPPAKQPGEEGERTRMCLRVALLRTLHAQAREYQAGLDWREVPAVPLPSAFHHSPECTSRLDTLQRAGKVAGE